MSPLLRDPHASLVLCPQMMDAKSGHVSALAGYPFMFGIPNLDWPEQ